MTMLSRRIAFWLFVVGLLGAALLAYGSSAPFEIQQLNSDATQITLANGGEVGQSIRPHFAGMTSISVRTQPNQAPGTDGVFFRLEADGRLILDTQDVRISNRPGWMTVDFSPIDGPLPLHYVFFIGNTSSRALNLQANAQNMYPEGAMTKGTGDLVFQARFRPPAGDALITLLSRLANRKPGIAGLPGIYPLILFGLTLSFLGFSHMFLHSLRQDQTR